MATYDADLQAAVDATSVAHAIGETDLLTYLRHELAERDIETADEAWLERMIEKLKADRSFMIDSEPEDYTRPPREV